MRSSGFGVLSRSRIDLRLPILADRSPAGSTWRGDSSDRAINPRSHQRLDPTKSRDSDLPRKEVIQPHLPVRLPCYDFVPITNPTFDGCPPCGLAHRLRVLPAFMT